MATEPDSRRAVLAAGAAAKARIERRMAAQRRAAERDPLVATLPVATDEEREQVQAAFDLQRQAITEAYQRISDVLRAWAASVQPSIAALADLAQRILDPASYQRKQNILRRKRLRAARLRARRSTQVRHHHRR